MKNAIPKLGLIQFLIFSLLCLNTCVSAQNAPQTSSSLPENVNKIVTTSCLPCHSSNGKFKVRFKLNLTNWNKYSPEKQKLKAQKMYSEIREGAMPPISARESNPEIIPTEEQISIIKKWAESFGAGTSK
jgi:uncharacterized membrane protein